MNLKNNETTRFQNLWNRGKQKNNKNNKKKKKKKKKKICIPLPNQPIENDPDPKYFFIETNRFFLLPKFIFCS